MTGLEIPKALLTGTAAGWTLVVLVIGGLITQMIKTRPRMRELERGAEEKLRDDLIKRVEKLERRLEEESGKREHERAKSEAVIALMRHRLNNSDQCIDSLLLLLETSPEKAKEAVALIKEMRSRQRDAEALEKATIAAVSIQTAAPARPYP